MLGLFGIPVLNWYRGTEAFKTELYCIWMGPVLAALTTRRLVPQAERSKPKFWEKERKKQASRRKQRVRKRAAWTGAASGAGGKLGERDRAGARERERRMAAARGAKCDVTLLWLQNK